MLTQLLSTLAQECRNQLKPVYRTPVAADGWTFRPVANCFNRPRSILFDRLGAILLVDARSGIKH
ncbi:hypothetical protein CDEST_11238 [Colletotrichum destructivum]|uniref:Uncharacterized protein n=1 Tax=Colletotrichum destructivum TaxID=34406 RepID=A0AAX4ISM1_9PEZI|nr:hypothetical protein CDEST_11238 [Colletotrichum destructivum]